MSYHVVSDLHIERFYPNVPDPKKLIPTNSKNLILAGGIGIVELWDQYFSFISLCCSQFDSVIFIPGDDEFRSLNNNSINMGIVQSKLKNIENLLSNFKYLNDDFIVFKMEKWILFGSCFWSYIPDDYFKEDYPIYNDTGYKISCSEWNYLHFYSRSKLEKAIHLSKYLNFSLKCVTHFAPTFKNTLDPQYKEKYNPKNYYYCSDSDQYLKSGDINSWLYGHTCYNNDFNFDNTRIFSNQNNKEGYNPQKTL